MAHPPGGPLAYLHHFTGRQPGPVSARPANEPWSPRCRCFRIPIGVRQQQPGDPEASGPIRSWRANQPRQDGNPTSPAPTPRARLVHPRQRPCRWTSGSALGGAVTVVVTGVGVAQNRAIVERLDAGVAVRERSAPGKPRSARATSSAAHRNDPPHTLVNGSVVSASPTGTARCCADAR